MKLDKVFVVKLQIPLASNLKNPKCLIYNKDKSFETYVAMDENIERAMKGRYKAFFKSGTIGKTFYLGTESEVKDPGW